MDIFKFIDVVILICSSLWLGYFLGTKQKKIDELSGYIKKLQVGIPLTSQEMIRANDLAKKENNTIQPGVIRRPTAKELNLRNIPQKEKEARAAVKESLDKIPELQKHKELLQKQKELELDNTRKYRRITVNG